MLLITSLGRLKSDVKFGDNNAVFVLRSTINIYEFVMDLKTSNKNLKRFKVGVKGTLDFFICNRTFNLHYYRLFVQSKTINYNFLA